MEHSLLEIAAFFAFMLAVAAVIWGLWAVAAVLSILEFKHRRYASGLALLATSVCLLYLAVQSKGSEITVSLAFLAGFIYCGRGVCMFIFRRFMERELTDPSFLPAEVGMNELERKLHRLRRNL